MQKKGTNIIHSTSQPIANVSRYAKNKAVFQLIDNRPEAIVQRRLAKILNGSSIKSESQPVMQRIVVDSSRPRWSLDKFDKPEQVYIDIAGRLGYGDDMIDQLKNRYPTLHETHVQPDDVRVDIKLLAEQAFAGKVESPQKMDLLSAKKNLIKQAISILTKVLYAAKIDFVIQGSSAQMMLGAAPHEAPGDVDVIVDNLALACKELVKAGFTQTEGSLAVCKFVENTTKVKFDIVIGGEMGPPVKNIGKEEIDGTKVQSAYETIISLGYRMKMQGKRPKDIEALMLLVMKNRYAFTKEQKTKVAEVLTTYMGGDAVRLLEG